MAARLFAPLASRVGFPAVLGELLLGVLLGNLTLVGLQYFESIPKDPIVVFIAELGVIFLLLQIGLETRRKDLVEVGGTAVRVGVVPRGEVGLIFAMAGRGENCESSRNPCSR